MKRRPFLESITAASFVPALLRQGTSPTAWGTPVFDLHHHLRAQPASNATHLDAVGITRANLLTRGAVREQVQALQASAPGRFIWFNSYDVTRPDAEQMLTQAVEDGALSRDAAFTADFLTRHQDKLLFGSDCGCSDGRGAGVSQSNNPAAARMAGKCVARETLTLLQKAASSDVFKKIVWNNAQKLLRIPA